MRHLAAAAVAAVLVAGCGGGSPRASTTSTTSGDSSTVASGGSDHEQALTFAACMRDNGVTDFPDPDSSGELTIDEIANRTSVDTDSAAFDQAMTACKDLQPSGFTGHTRTPEQQAAALEFAQCIRDKGVTDFPDPTPDSPMIDTNRIPSAATQRGMDILHAAMQQCHGIVGRAGVDGP